MAHQNKKAGFKTVKLFKDRILGIGSFGKVCKAECDDLLCAAKLMHETLFDLTMVQLAEPQNEQRLPLRRFEQECEFLSTIRHPNIIQYLGMYQYPETHLPVLLMELMDESLTHFLEHSPQPIPYHIQVNICHDITLAISFLHSNGIVHRDLSGNNVLMIGNVRAKVTDFGMVRLGSLHPSASHLTFTMCPGTDVYMPPEAVKDVPVYTEKIDCFSFGVITVQILTRLFPTPGNRRKEIEIDNVGLVEKRISEYERRQNHISEIDPNHPLLPIALSCLKDKDIERPSAHHLCRSIAGLKEDSEYSDSVKSVKEKSIPEKESGTYKDGRPRLHHAKGLHETDQSQFICLEERDLSILQKDETGEIQQIRQQLQQHREESQQVEREKDRMIEEKDRVIEEKDRTIAQNDETITVGQQEIQQLRQQLQQYRENIQQIERERDKVIEEKDRIIEEKCESIAQKDEAIAVGQQEIQQLIQQQREKIEQIEKEKDREIEEKNRLNEEKSKTITQNDEIIAAGQQEIQQLRQQLRHQGEKTEQIEKEKDRAIKEKDRMIEEKNQIATQNDETIKVRQQEIQQLRLQLQQQGEKIQQIEKEKDRVIKEKDRMIEEKGKQLQHVNQWLEARKQWTSVALTSMTSPNLRQTGTMAHNIPNVIPSSAKEVLVLATILVGHCGPSERVHYIKIYTQQGSQQYAKYIVLKSWQNGAWSTNSDNLWFPMTSGRQVFVELTTAHTGNLGMTLHVVGYR